MRNRNDTRKEIKKVLQDIENEINESLKKGQWPECCGMLGNHRPSIAFKETATDFSDSSVTFRIDLPRVDLKQLQSDSLCSYIKRKMKNENLQPDDKNFNKSDIKVVKRMGFTSIKGDKVRNLLWEHPIWEDAYRIFFYIDFV